MLKDSAFLDNPFHCSYSGQASLGFPILFRVCHFRFCEVFFALLERLWRKNQAIFRSLIRNILMDPSGVEDVLQEAFVKLLECNKHFSTQNEAYNYIRKVVLNTSIDHFRSLRRQKNHILCALVIFLFYPAMRPIPYPFSLRKKKTRSRTRSWKRSAKP